jgi:orotidine-5'-phosphate decarboxylase
MAIHGQPGNGNRARICVALDMPDAAAAAGLARRLAGAVDFAKVGMELFYAAGPEGYARVARAGLPIFLDLKLHDIPNTVARGLSALLALTPPPAIVNVHASGGPAMLRAAAEAVDGRAKLVAVTVLTALSGDDLAAIGLAGPPREAVLRLARLAKECGLDGVVCSPEEVADIRAALGEDFLTIVPGIRPAGAAMNDQKRAATPEAAQAAGADILVIGRPITQAPDPVAAAVAIGAALERSTD